jgi:hypothetical protein
MGLDEGPSWPSRGRAMGLDATHTQNIHTHTRRHPQNLRTGTPKVKIFILTQSRTGLSPRCRGHFQTTLYSSGAGEKLVSMPASKLLEQWARLAVPSRRVRPQLVQLPQLAGMIHGPEV